MKGRGKKRERTACRGEKIKKGRRLEVKEEERKADKDGGGEDTHFDVSTVLRKARRKFETRFFSLETPPSMESVPPPVSSSEHHNDII